MGTNNSLALMLPSNSTDKITMLQVMGHFAKLSLNVALCGIPGRNPIHDPTGYSRIL